MDVPTAITNQIDQTGAAQVPTDREVPTPAWSEEVERAAHATQTPQTTGAVGPTDQTQGAVGVEG